jgi:hypothetical protein
MSAELSLREELLRAVDAVTILSPTAFTFAGTRSNGIGMPMIGLRLTPEMPPLMSELTGQLYEHCFSHRFTGQVAPSETRLPEKDSAWGQILARANQSQERWEGSWQVVHSMPNGQVLARRGVAVRVFAPGEFVNLSGSGMLLAPGTAIRVYVPNASFAAQPGYYFVFGETLCDSSDEFSVVRFYWNISEEGVPDLLQRISGELNQWQIPFRFKTGLNRAMFSRRDSAVLYTPRRYARFAFELALRIHPRIHAGLRDDVPLFTQHLAPGFAFAEDPGTQESFGMSRCRLLAQGIWLAHQKGAQGRDGRWTLLQQQFHSEGISLERPWLNAGSANEFAFAPRQQEAA